MKPVLVILSAAKDLLNRSWCQKKILRCAQDDIFLTLSAKCQRVLLCFFLFFSFKTSACDGVDDIGRKLHLEHPAKRVISLAPDLTEIMFAIGAGDRVVGVMQGSHFPLEAKKIPIVASFNTINLEKIAALHPDLILVWGEGKISHSLKKLSVPVYVSTPKNLLDVSKTMRKLGSLVGTENEAKKAQRRYLKLYELIKARYTDEKKVTVFYQVWSKPLITITKKSWINDAIVLCGGKNIFSDLYGVAPQVNIEEIIKANPDIIISNTSDPGGQQFWRRWRSLKAVKNDHVFSINADLIERAGPRLVVGAQQLCELIEKGRAL